MLHRRHAALVVLLPCAVALGGCTSTLANRRDLFSPPDEHPRLAAAEAAELARLRRGGDPARPGAPVTTTATVTTTTTSLPPAGGQ